MEVLPTLFSLQLSLNYLAWCVYGNWTVTMLLQSV